MSAPDTKAHSERPFSKKPTSPVSDATAKKVIRRLQTDANLHIRGGATQAAASPAMDASRDPNRRAPSYLSCSPTESSLHHHFHKRRTDRSNTMTCDSASTSDSMQPSSPSSNACKMKEIRANVQRIVDKNRPTVEQLNRLGEAFQSLLNDKFGLELFREFLRTEFCQENIDFWCACEDYRKSNGLNELTLKERAQRLYDEFVSEDASRQVNLDSETRKRTAAVVLSPKIDTTAFELSQKRIQSLMERDKYQRFLQSDIYRYAVDAVHKLWENAHFLREPHGHHKFFSNID